MKKNISSAFLIIFGVAALYASTSKECMRYISYKRNVKKWWGTYQLQQGDLVTMAYLEKVKKFSDLPNNFNYPKPECKGRKDKAVYLVGDSYTILWWLSAANFTGTRDLYQTGRRFGGTFHLKNDVKNILIVEVSERLFRSYFNTCRMLNEFVEGDQNSTTGVTKPATCCRFYSSIFPNIAMSDIFNPHINQNLQLNLFNYNFIIPLFEYKAAINYIVFGRASGDVTLSDNGNFLFSRATLRTQGDESCIVQLPEEAITAFVDTLNRLYDHYKRAGFSEIYLSIIPNAITVVQPPKDYNKLIPRIQGDSRLKMKIIDAFDDFQKSPTFYYQPGDTHWNENGLVEWMRLVNISLSRDFPGDSTCTSNILN